MRTHKIRTHIHTQVGTSGMTRSTYSNITWTNILYKHTKEPPEHKLVFIIGVVNYWSPFRCSLFNYLKHTWLIIIQNQGSDSLRSLCHTAFQIFRLILCKNRIPVIMKFTGWKIAIWGAGASMTRNSQVMCPWYFRYATMNNETLTNSHLPSL